MSSRVTIDLVADLESQLTEARKTIERYRLWMLGFMESTGGEVSNVDPLVVTEHTVWHGIVRICAEDGSSEMYLTDTEDAVADWLDSPFGKVEWVVEPAALAAVKDKPAG